MFTDPRKHFVECHVKNLVFAGMDIFSLLGFACVILIMLHGYVLVLFAAVVCVLMCLTLFLSLPVQVSGV
jgi:hypothetical protein